MKLTFIGNGNMAKSLIEGLVKNYEIQVPANSSFDLKIKTVTEYCCSYIEA